MWVVFAKGDQPGWTAIIPILNLFVLLKLVKRPLWRVLLMLIPCVNIIVLIMVMRDLSKAFDHGVGFTVGLVFLNTIFMLVLAFGRSRYQLEREPIF